MAQPVTDAKGRYAEGEVNIHYRSPIRREEKDYVPEDELRKRQEDQVTAGKIRIRSVRLPIILLEGPRIDTKI